MKGKVRMGVALEEAWILRGLQPPCSHPHCLLQAIYNITYLVAPDTYLGTVLAFPPHLYDTSQALRLLLCSFTQLPLGFQVASSQRQLLLQLHQAMLLLLQLLPLVLQLLLAQRQLLLVVQQL